MQDESIKTCEHEWLDASPYPMNRCCKKCGRSELHPRVVRAYWDWSRTEQFKMYERMFRRASGGTFVA